MIVHFGYSFAWPMVVASALASGCMGDPNVDLDDASEHFIAAQQALAQGDKAKAMQELSISLEQEPYDFAYLARAKLHLENGDEAQALADCEAGLALAETPETENADLKWLQGELKKPANQRFKGPNANPPSAVK
jgi:hypothetical protein